jgi:hypothetical protein
LTLNIGRVYNSATPRLVEDLLNQTSLLVRLFSLFVSFIFIAPNAVPAPRIRPHIQQTATVSAVTSQVDPSALPYIAGAKSAIGQASGLPPAITAIGEIESVATGIIQPFRIDVLSPGIFKTQSGPDPDGNQYSWTANNGPVLLQSGSSSRRLRFPVSFAERCALLPLHGAIYDSTFTRVALSNTASTDAVSASNPVLTFEYHLPVLNGVDIVSTKQIELDAKTLLPVRLLEFNQNEGNPDIASRVEYLFGEYGIEGTFLLPHVIEVHTDGQSTSIIRLKQFVVGASLDPNEFVVR